MNYKRLAIVSGVIAGVAATGLGTAYALQRPKAAWMCGKKPEGASYIFKSGNEYIIAYPANTYNTNSFLLTGADQRIPKRWKPDNTKKIEILSSGFQYLTSYDYDGGTSSTFVTSFNTDKGLLSSKNVDSKEAPSSEKCTKVDWASADSDTAGKLSGVPLEYLKLRSRMVDLLNPKLGEKDFNVKLADAAMNIKNGEYSVYKLLSSIDRKELNTDQIDTVEQAKKKLLNSTSSETTIWESNSMFTYYPSNETEQSARERCSRPSSSLAYYTGNGYEIVSSNAENKSMGKGLQCQGTFYLLRKEGYID